MDTTLSSRCVCNPQPASDLHAWPVYLVSVPTDWEPLSWKALPPFTKRFRTARLAAEVCAMLNRDKLERSKDGTVIHWYIRIRSSATHGVVGVSVPNGFQPEDEYDFPVEHLKIDGPYPVCKTIVSNLNNRLRDKISKDGLRTMRAVMALSIRPEHLVPEKPVESDLTLVWE